MKRSREEGSSAQSSKRAKCTAREEGLSCPIWDHQEQVLTAIYEHDLVILLGSPGQGKSTQLPQMVFESRLNGLDTIGVVHTSAASAISTAQTVARQMQVTLGAAVGFKTRFETCCGPRTKLQFITDGCLLREMFNDELLESYGVLILDDVHQRRWQTDLLLRFLRKICERRRRQKMSLSKLVLMGSLMDTNDLILYFDTLQSRVVFLSNSTPPSELKCKDLVSTVPADHVVTAVRTAVLLHKNYQDGDILCFLASRSEVLNAAFLARCLLAASNGPGGSPPSPVRAIALTLYEGMPKKAMERAVAPAPEGCRKIIFCDAIAENSMKISGVRIVVDSGYCQVKDFLELPSIPGLGLERLSSAQSWFRETRARAEGPALLYRLYSRPEPPQRSTIFPAPELERVNLAPAVLFSLRMNCNAYNFPSQCQHFVNQFTSAIHQLMSLGAVIERGEPSQLRLTRLGHLMVRLPLDVPAARALLAGPELGCSAELITVMAMLCCGPLFHDFGCSPEEFQRARRRFASEHGDCVSLLLIYRGYRAAVDSGARSWCRRHCINPTSLRLAFRIRKRLRAIFRGLGLSVRSCGSDLSRINAAFTQGYIFCLSRHVRAVTNGTVHHGYRSVFTGHHLELSHESSLFASAAPEFLVHLGAERASGGGREIRMACPVDIAFANKAFPDLISARGEFLDDPSP